MISNTNAWFLRFGEIYGGVISGVRRPLAGSQEFVDLWILAIASIRGRFRYCRARSTVSSSLFRKNQSSNNTEIRLPKIDSAVKDKSQIGRTGYPFGTFVLT